MTPPNQTLVTLAAPETETGLREDLIQTVMRLTKESYENAKCFVDDLLDTGCLDSLESEQVARSLGRRAGG